ncbi:D-alanine--D-alanine ligase family protein [Candidatus Riflebacteria bacterium]
MKKTRVTVLFGGRSSEHEVSILSARAIANNLDEDQFEVLPVAISKTGQLLNPEKSQTYLESGHARIAQLQEKTIPTPIDEKSEVKDKFLKLQEETALAPNFLKDTDVFFPVLHGPYGEDGRLQGWLDMMNVPYVGCGVLGSACGMDKIIAKQLFLVHGLLSPGFCYAFKYEWQEDEEKVLQKICKNLPFPIFIKPANLGSSIGVSKCNNPDELKNAITDAFNYDRKVIAEEGINARELEISVLGNAKLRTSVIGEIVPEREFYDYHSKYKGGKSDLIIPAKLKPQIRDEVSKMAKTAFRACDCSGLARVDFLYDEENEKVYLNELNTMPGFTSISMYPKLWEASGLPYKELLTELVTLAKERFFEQQDLSSNYADSI